jgi:hypothetical protein
VSIVKVLSILHPDLRKAIPKLISINSKVEEAMDSEVVFSSSIIAEYRAVLSDLVTSYGDNNTLVSGVYSFPMLSSTYCQSLKSKTDKYTYLVNECECSEAQIPEVVLEQQDKELFDTLGLLFTVVTGAITISLLGSVATTLSSVQFAKYTPENTSEGSWHVDEDSDISLVIPITNEYEGGGTLVNPYGLSPEITVPALPVGHAMLFNGRAHYHKGLPVTKGSRDLLVFWATSC